MHASCCLCRPSAGMSVTASLPRLSCATSVSAQARPGVGKQCLGCTDSRLQSTSRKRSQLLARSNCESRPAVPSAERIAANVTSLFPLWVALGCFSGLWQPQLYDWFQPAYVTGMLAVTMLGMGFTLTVKDITDVFANPVRVSIGTALQYSIMPCLGFLLSRLPGIPPGFAAGIILVACCPGGTASNIITYLARADVALSVMMTTASTLAAVVMTPFLTTKLIGTLVPVDGMALFVSTLQVVLAPVLAGVTLKRVFPRAVDRISPFSPVLAVLMVAVICAAVMARSAAAAKQASLALFGAVFGLHAGGFALGYAVSKVLGMPEPTARTNSIEVGMQNSTLGASLAILHFADPLTAAPCAISACMHSIMGSAIAGVWRMIPPEGTPEEGSKGSAAAA